MKTAILPDISGHFHIREGFYRPDWEAISEIIERNLPEPEWNSAWEAAARRWVDSIRDRLGRDYQVCETDNFIILSRAPPRVIRDACRSYEESRRRILAGLEGVASGWGYGKHVVMMFADIDDYYGYITYFYPEGEHPQSGGVCLSGEGYVHFAFPVTDYLSYRTVLVHELTHGCLEHLPVPIWLNEALAMRMEELICGSNVFQLNREIRDRHAAHWNRETIQEFWAGRSWGIPGESFELSYNLAQIIWRKVETDLTPSRADTLEFISAAHFEDGGEAACVGIFGLSLGDLVTDFLGEGDWAPEPEKWILPGKSEHEIAK